MALLGLVGAGLAALAGGGGASAANTTFTIYPGTPTPANPAERDSNAVELGVRFTVSSPGSVLSIRYYKSSANLGTHVGTLWTGTGTALATGTFQQESRSGWQVLTLANPVAVKPGVTYVASYHTNSGYYAQQEWAFAGGATLGNSAIRATAGTYRYGGGGFPAQTWHAAAYFVDVAFRPDTTSSSTSTASAPSSAASSTSAGTTASTSAAPKPSASTSSTSLGDTSAPPASAPSSATTSASAGGATTSAAAPSGSFPNATNTGVPAGTTLTTVPGQKTSGTGWHWDSRGWVQIDSVNTTLSGLDINGSVHSSKNGLTITSSRIRCTNETSWCVTLADTSKVTDTEIGGGTNGTTFLPAIGVLSGDYQASISGNILQRLNIHHTIHGMRIDGDTTVLDSYIHDLPVGDAPYQDAHTDGIMSTAGGNVVIRHNTMSSATNCPLFVQWSSGSLDIGSYLVENNQFLQVVRNGQEASWGVSIENKGINGPITVRNNTFSKGWQAGPISVPPGSSASGNVYSDGTPATAQIN